MHVCKCVCADLPCERSREDWSHTGNLSHAGGEGESERGRGGERLGGDPGGAHCSVPASAVSQSWQAQWRCSHQILPGATNFFFVEWALCLFSRPSSLSLSSCIHLTGPVVIHPPSLPTPHPSPPLPPTRPASPLPLSSVSLSLACKPGSPEAVRCATQVSHQMKQHCGCAAGNGLRLTAPCSVVQRLMPLHVSRFCCFDLAFSSACAEPCPALPCPPALRPSASGVADAIAKILRYEGVAGFYRGMGTKMAQSVFAASMLFLTQEELVKAARLMLLSRSRVRVPVPAPGRLRAQLPVPTRVPTPVPVSPMVPASLPAGSREGRGGVPAFSHKRDSLIA